MNNCPSSAKTAIDYHERAADRLPDRFAASLGYLDGGYDSRD